MPELSSELEIPTGFVLINATIGMECHEFLERITGIDKSIGNLTWRNRPVGCLALTNEFFFLGANNSIGRIDKGNDTLFIFKYTRVSLESKLSGTGSLHFADAVHAIPGKINHGAYNIGNIWDGMLQILSNHL